MKPLNNKLMKKTKVVLFMFVMVAICTGAYIGHRVNNPSAHTQFSDLNLAGCEAIANCEVYRTDGTLVIECSGDRDVCWNEGGVYCPGTKVN